MAGECPDLTPLRYRNNAYRQPDRAFNGHRGGSTPPLTLPG